MIIKNIKLYDNDSCTERGSLGFGDLFRVIFGGFIVLILLAMIASLLIVFSSHT